MNEKLKKTFQWISAIIIVLAVFGCCFWLGTLTYDMFHKNSAIPPKGTPIVIKDSVETKKLRAVVDSVVKENKRLEAIIKRKQSNVSQILINNAINKEKVLSASDSTVIYLLDSLLSNGKIGLMPAAPKGYVIRIVKSEAYEADEDQKRRNDHEESFYKWRRRLSN